MDVWEVLGGTTTLELAAAEVVALEEAVGAVAPPLAPAPLAPAPLAPAPAEPDADGFCGEAFPATTAGPSPAAAATPAITLTEAAA